MTSHKNVYMALAAAQAEMEQAKKSSVNPHFKSKYADLASVVDAVRPALNKHGLAFFHVPKETELGRSVETVLVHGESETSIVAGVPIILSKNDMQGYKSAVTYAKRIGLESVTGIAPEDDDGNAAAAAQKKTDYAVRDKSWAETVIDHLPEGATEHDKAIALRDAIIAEFKRKKTETQLSNEWDRRAKLIDGLEAKKQGIRAEIVDAYETRMMAVTGQD